jgi:hypothetical protein
MARIVSDHLRLSPEAKFDLRRTGYTPQPGGTTPSSDRVRALDDHDATAHLLRSLLPDVWQNLSPGPVSNSLKPGVAAEWSTTKTLPAGFETLSDHDFWPGVVSRLQEIRDANPQKFREYRALAVALAVVYDQKFPSFWPHHQVDPKLVPVAEVPVADRFKFWTESNESGALFFDLRQLSPGQIKFVVDAPVRASELDWARRNVRYQRSEFAKAFDAVVYSSGRMKTGNLEWKTGEYTLRISSPERIVWTKPTMQWSRQSPWDCRRCSSRAEQTAAMRGSLYEGRESGTDLRQYEIKTCGRASLDPQTWLRKRS